MDRRLFICFVLLLFIFVLVACGNYGEKVQNAVMINGILIDKSLFEITDDGKMTTTLSKLLTAQDLTTLEKSSLNMYLKMYQKDEIIDMKTMLELHRIKEDFSVYYVAALNSYIITFCPTMN